MFLEKRINSSENVLLIADTILDYSHKENIILVHFEKSGTTLIDLEEIVSLHEGIWLEK